MTSRKMSVIFASMLFFVGLAFSSDKKIDNDTRWFFTDRHRCRDVGVAGSVAGSALFDYRMVKMYGNRYVPVVPNVWGIRNPYKCWAMLNVAIITTAAGVGSIADYFRNKNN